MQLLEPVPDVLDGARQRLRVKLRNAPASAALDLLIVEADGLAVDEAA